MIVGYVPGTGPLHRAHPFTTLTLAAVVAVLAFVLPAPGGTAILCGLTLLLPVVEGVPGVLIPAAVTLLPFWLFLLVIHGVFRDSPLVAIGLGCRFTAIVVTFLTILAALQPGRLIDALVERGAPFS